MPQVRYLNAIANAEAHLYEEGASPTDVLPVYPVPSRWYSSGVEIQVANHKHIATYGMVTDAWEALKDYMRVYNMSQTVWILCLVHDNTEILSGWVRQDPLAEADLTVE